MTLGTSAHATRVAALLDALPQTQCTRCGYPDCAAYANAIASGEAGINQCPPGGAEGVQRLAAITGLPATAIDPTFGQEGPRSVVFIDEAWCIGCTLCIDACPTDAIMGVAKRMHTVIEPRCTGCELCVPACPVDCIAMENASGKRTGWNAWSAAQADAAREQYRVRTLRRERELAEDEGRCEQTAQASLAESAETASGAGEAALAKKKQVVEAALARARGRHQGAS